MCEHYHNNQCNIINTYLKDVEVPGEVCIACCCTEKPKQLNSVIVDFTSFIYHKRTNEYMADFWMKELKATKQPIENFPSLLSRIRNAHGPGIYLIKRIPWFMTVDNDCKCDERLALMNKWGPTECLNQFDTISNWIYESAVNKNIELEDVTVVNAITNSILRSYVKVSQLCHSKEYNALPWTEMCARLCQKWVSLGRTLYT